MAWECRSFSFPCSAHYGIDEYYIHDPDEGTLKGWSREGTWFQPIPDMNGWGSPLMGIRFEVGWAPPKTWLACF